MLSESVAADAGVIEFSDAEEGVRGFQYQADNPTERFLFDVNAAQYDGDDNWYVSVAIAEFIRDEPTETLFRATVDEALQAVAGVDSVSEEDREIWLVEGRANGRDLVTATVEGLAAILPALKAYLRDAGDLDDAFRQ
ncbi:MAG: hypothetical protein AAGC71_14120 [Pseudomonadota bacterium]